MWDPTQGAVRSRRRLPRWAIGVGLVVALFLLFEIGIRHLHPDGMTVTYEAPHSPTYTYVSPADQQTIVDYYDLLHNAPTTFTDINGCPPIAYPQFVFTWHGVPVEAWSGGCAYMESAGGIPDFFTLRFHVWLPDGPLPPPAHK